LRFTTALVSSQTDYRPFGQVLKERTWQSGEYSFGFNGKENDKASNWQDYGMRYYMGASTSQDYEPLRFPNVDPLTQKYPELTPYQFASNTPIMAIDLDGLEADFSGVKYRYIKTQAEIKVIAEGNIKFGIKLINLSSNKNLDMKKIADEVSSETNAYFTRSKEYIPSGNERFIIYLDGSFYQQPKGSKGFPYVSYETNIEAKVEITIINDINKINHDDYVLAIVDEIPALQYPDGSLGVDPAGMAAAVNSRIAAVEAKFAYKGKNYNTGTHEELHAIGGLDDDYDAKTGIRNKNNLPNIMQGGDISSVLLPQQKTQISKSWLETMRSINARKKTLGRSYETHAKDNLKSFFKKNKIKSTIK